MTRKLAVLDAPCHFGVRPEEPDAVPGSHRMAYAIRQRDLVARLGARDVGQIEPPEPDPANPCPVGCQGVPRFIQALAARTREIVTAREFPVVIGGECSILVGNMLGLRGLGRFGLVFVGGGHEDLAHGDELGPHGSLLTAAGLDLAVATGNGPAALANLQGLRPYVDEQHVVLFGLTSGEDVVDPDVSDAPFRIERVRAAGARAAAERALRYLEELPLDGFWIHVDADVLDPPCDCDVDEELPYRQLTEALRVFLASDRAVGLELTIYDPELDPDGACGERLVDSVVRAFQPNDDEATDSDVV